MLFSVLVKDNELEYQMR